MPCFDGRQYHRRGVSMTLRCVHSLRIIVAVKIIGPRSSHGTVENCAFARAIDDVNSSYSSEDLRRVVMMMATSKATKRQ
jgi:hypothetical protein